VNRKCDHCGGIVHPDRNGWWAGDDETSDCDGNESGHEVKGEGRA
jgi:hypothetical protein